MSQTPAFLGTLGRPAWQRKLTRKRGPTILLIEDDTELRRLIAKLLRKDGYDVVECENGDAAIDWLGDGVFDGYYERLPALIVSDVRLPHFDGLEILEVMRGALARVPMILITAFPESEVYRRAFALGARNVLAKPFELDDLRAAVWVALAPTHRPRSQT